jgi:hypothetical protein
MEQLQPRPQWIRNTLSYFFEHIFDITTIVIAICFFVRHYFKPYGPDDIAEMVAWIVALLGLVTASALWPQHLRLNRIETLGRETRDLIIQKLSEPARSQDFFWADDRVITAQDLTQAHTIYVVGMVLTRTARNHMTILNRRLVAGANLRFIILDWKNETLMRIMPHRSFGSHPGDWWKEHIRQTEGYIQDIHPLKGCPGTLQVGYLPYFPSFGMWLIDPDEPHGKIHIEIYHHRTPDKNPTFSLHATEDGHWYEFFCNQFEIMWESCRDDGRIVSITASSDETEQE